jgi:hypothetical protein
VWQGILLYSGLGGVNGADLEERAEEFADTLGSRVGLDQQMTTGTREQCCTTPRY